MLRLRGRRTPTPVALAATVACAIAAAASLTAPAAADPALADTIERVRPSIVGIGTFAPLRRPRAKLLGTGFAVADGRLIATNHHVVDTELDTARNEKLVAFTGRGREPDLRDARIVGVDQEHDLALLRIDGDGLPAMTLAGDSTAREGDSIAFTGFPIGAILGLFPVTHRGIISAVTPVVIPMDDSRSLASKHIRALRDPYVVFQLDATAYPGNSGSPMYGASNGHVIGVINQVLVKGTKESILKDPSAISYAIPVKYLRELIDRIER